MATLTDDIMDDLRWAVESGSDLFYEEQEGGKIAIYRFTDEGDRVGPVGHLTVTEEVNDTVE